MAAYDIREVAGTSAVIYRIFNFYFLVPVRIKKCLDGSTVRRQRAQ